jgi:SAM-dependent methyltransferase
MSTLHLDIDALRAAMEPLLLRCFSSDLTRAYAYIDRLCLHLCFHLVEEFHLLKTRCGTFADLMARVGLVPDAAYLLTTIFDILAEEGFVICTEDGWEGCRPCPPDDSADLQREARVSCPQAQALFELIERCHDHAPAFLTGREPGMATAFPRGDIRLWERIHTIDGVMSIYADLIPPALEAILGQEVRLLEVGAGVGAVMQRCLPLLCSRSTQEYWFTDLGKLFVQRAQRTYGRESFMRFSTVNLDLPLTSQGLVPASFDAVIAVNVLHVAKDLAFTLRELYTMLKTPGYLVCAEGSPPDWQRRWRLDLVFAFLRGWWDVSIDPILRPRCGFLLPTQWTKALLTCGYQKVHALPGEEWFAGPCRGGLIIAEKGAS